MTNYTVTEKTQYIATNLKDVVHYGVVETGLISTGQPELFTYDNIQDWTNQLLELGVKQEDIDKSINPTLP